MVIVKLGDGGKISMFINAGAADVIVDVLGWFPTGDTFGTLTPTRIMDSRPDGTTADGLASGGGPLVAGSIRDLSITSRGAFVAAGVGAVALNITVTNPTAPAFLTVWPAGVARPNAANLNFTAGQTVPNMVIVKLGDGGKISMYVNAGSTDVIVDVLGWFPTGPGYTGLIPARLMDTRPDSGTPVVTASPSTVPPSTVPTSPTVTAIQVVYAVPADVAVVAGRREALAHTVAEARHWFDTQTSGRHPRVVLDGATVSVLTVTLPQTQAAIMTLGQYSATCGNACDRLAMVTAIHQQYPATIGKGLIIELDGTIVNAACGYTSQQDDVIVIPMANCAIYPTNDTFPYGGTYLVAHELTHMLGAAPSCAPHQVANGHVSDDPRDIIYSGSLGRDWTHLTLDVGHDDYYLTGRTDCPDIANSPLLGSD